MFDKKKIIVSLCLFGLAGCASIPLPAERLERSEASIRSAQEVGALGVPQAKLHVQLARDQTELAKQLAKKGDERAVLVLARAEADAELALALAREAAVHADAVKATQQLNELKNRPTP